MSPPAGLCSSRPPGSDAPAAIEAAGARIVTDTCAYVTPVLAPGVRMMMTSTGKWAWYALGNLGIDTVPISERLRANAVTVLEEARRRSCTHTAGRGLAKNGSAPLCAPRGVCGPDPSV
jgi:hypothetical protein